MNPQSVRSLISEGLAGSTEEIANSLRDAESPCVPEATVSSLDNISSGHTQIRPRYRTFMNKPPSLQVVLLSEEELDTSLSRK